MVFFSEEYTKITTPRQDVLFKKGYLGRKRPTAAPTADSTANVNSSSGINPDNMAADIANGNYSVNGTAEQGEGKVQFSKMEKTRIILNLRRLMSYIYGAPILDVSRSHTTTQHSR